MTRRQNKSGRIRHRFTGPVPITDYHKIFYLALSEEDVFFPNCNFERYKIKSMSPKTFVCPEKYECWITQFCSPQSQVGAQVGIDMTYKIGPFFTTTLTMQHPMFVIRGSVCHPTILLTVMTSQGKSIHDYNFLAQNLHKMGVKQLIYGTDGERPLEQAGKPFSS